jgi:hypothetical protein
VAGLVARSEAEPDVPLIFPTVRRSRPYVHVARDPHGGIAGILHRREGDVLPDVGESDIGLFCLSREAYLDLLPEYARNPVTGRATGERNFLPFLAWLSARARVSTLPAHDERESIGINTIEELDLLEQCLAEREHSTALRRGSGDVS